MDAVITDSFDELKAIYPHPQLMKAEWVRDGEEKKLKYIKDGYRCLKDIRREDMQVRYAVLLSMVKLEKLRERFDFDMSPSNLWYDRNNNLIVMERKELGKIRENDDFLEVLKAEIGYVLQDKLSYEDFRQGGLSLLKKKKNTSVFYDKQSVKEIEEILKNSYEEIYKLNHEKKTLVDKRFVNNIKTIIFSLSAVSLAFILFSVYQFFYIRPFNEAVKAGFEAYTVADYAKCEKAMLKVSVTRMNAYQKYILDESYIRTADLTEEQKKNILSNISVKSDNTLMNYWIYVGRGQAEKAEDCAMKLSDNQLLLYAYMKHKAMVEANNKLTGEKKAAKLKELKSNIEALMEEYEDDEDKK